MSKRPTPNRLTLLRSEYRAAVTTLNGAIKAKAWHTVARLRDQKLAIHLELLKLEAEEADKAGSDKTPEELFAILTEQVRQLPLDYVERLDDVVQSRLNPASRLRLVED